MVDFWLAEGALDDREAAAKRADQVLCVGRDGDGAIWAVGTAFLGVLSTLGQPTYFCRAFIAARRRGTGGMMPFFRKMRDMLEAHNRSLPQPEAIGILLELQNEMLSKHYRRAYEPDADAYFIGYSPRGHQLRVVYFEDARLLLPPRRRSATGTRARRALAVEAGAGVSDAATGGQYLVQLFLPLNDNTGAAFPRALFDDVRRELTDAFGGATAFLRAPAVGAWEDDDGDVQRDEVVLLEVMADTLDRAWWARYRRDLERRFQQDEVRCGQRRRGL